MTELKLYNTLTRKEETFQPIDPSHVRMYACGPTVYDRAHIGNARSAVVYDVLYRLLKHLYPQVTYARNITDVDDKINAAAKANGEPISALTKRVTQWFHDDTGALNVLKPDIEPRATEHIGEMIAMIQTLIAKGHAYAAEGHVLFAVESDPHYGCLSGRSVEDMIAGARVEVAPYKKYPGDFVLWKPALADDDPSSVFDSPWGKGRPGWHIECSAMSNRYLDEGKGFDIHGGGADLMFPHHENEIAQSTCATGHDFARYWVHNGFLTVNGEKMSKSLGNFITVRDLLDKGVKGEVIRFALLSTHYRKPLDWTDKLLEDAQKNLNRCYSAYYLQWYDGGLDMNSEDFQRWEERYLEFQRTGEWDSNWTTTSIKQQIDNFINLLKNDLNIPAAIAVLLEMTKLKSEGALGNAPLASYNPQEFFGFRVALKKCSEIIGILTHSEVAWFKGDVDIAIDTKIADRIAAKKARDFAAADRIREELKADGIILEDRPDGTTDWRRI